MKVFGSITSRQALLKMPALFILLLACLLFSCATADKPSYLKMIDNVPFYAQEEYQCGPASLAGVMNFWGADITPDEIARDIFSKSAKGTLDIDMFIYPEKKGFTAEQYSGGIDDLRGKIDAGYPMIVMVDYGILMMQVNHFMTVIGYSEDGVIVNSGKDRAKFIPEKDFLKVWERTKFWTLMIRKK